MSFTRADRGPFIPRLIVLEELDRLMMKVAFRQ